LKYFAKSVAIFEQSQGLNGLPVDVANQVQAMSQAYAYLGKNERAVELIREAIRLSDLIPSTVYSSFQYKNIPAARFKEESENFLNTLAAAGVPPNSTTF
jgi:hypothetical protein